MEKNHLIGAHISISGGFDKAITRTLSIDCDCLQIFTKSNRQWKARAISEEEAHRFKQEVKNFKIKKVIAHASYLINLSSSNSETRTKSRLALIEELNRCNQLGIHFLVLHPGIDGHKSKQNSLQQIAEGINKAFCNTHKTSLLLENQAGQGKSIGKSFEDLKQIYQMVDQKNRIGFCFDTCHAFAAGYDLRTEKAYLKTLKELDEVLGLNQIKAIHINDSKCVFKSCIDRHENIGKGQIGIKAFQLLINDSRLKKIPKILETPIQTELDYLEDLKKIKALIKNKD